MKWETTHNAMMKSSRRFEQHGADCVSALSLDALVFGSSSGKKMKKRTVAPSPKRAKNVYTADGASR